MIAGYNAVETGNNLSGYLMVGIAIFAVAVLIIIYKQPWIRKK